VTLTPRALNRATLARQLLLERESLGVVEAVRRVVALQAQEPASPYIALWSRMAAFDPAALDDAFRRGAMLKATLMRITLHAVDAAEYPVFHDAMQPTLRASRLYDRRFKATGLSIADADALIPPLVTFTARPRMNADVEAWLTERIGELPEPGAWWALRTYGPFVHAPTGGPWSFNQRPAYVAAAEQARPGDPEASLRHLVRRYLEGFGPASIADISQFALVPRARVRAAVDALGDALERREGPGRAELLDVPDGSLPTEDAPAPARLLPMWDSTLLAYVDRGRILPEAYRRLVIRTNGDVLPALLVDGYVAGVWRPTDEGIEATAFAPLSASAWRELEAEAVALLRWLVQRDPAPYRRYARWWTSLPAAEVRLLAP
jgi:hypothetical protein